MSHHLLLIEDDPAFARRMQANLRTTGYRVETADSGESGVNLLRSTFFDLVVADIRLPDTSGLDILRRVKEGRGGLDADTPIVMLTSVRDVDTAVEAMRAGASDYLTKESEREEILMRIEKVLEQSALLNENRALRDQLEKHSEFGEMIGKSPAMQSIKQEIADLAGQNVPVLIMGETGVGKELVARALHRTGGNPKGPFVEVNCGALPDENLLLSELFGHEKGAFTGANSLRKGKFELARDGSLFLDEIGEMPLESQAKILRTIETLQITRLGGSRPIEVACRLLFATNKDLEQEVQEGRFRSDLYYRINLLPLRIPPLRERVGDIPLLTRFFLSEFCKKYRKPSLRMNGDAVEAMQEYSWPGNVRELRNVVERLAIRARGEEIRLEDLQRCGVIPSGTKPEAIVLPEEGIPLEEVERRLVTQALERTDWNQKQAAALLDISVDRMNARVRKFGLRHPSWRVNR